jgi:hypothetical protein
MLMIMLALMLTSILRIDIDTIAYRVGNYSILTEYIQRQGLVPVAQATLSRASSTASDAESPPFPSLAHMNLIHMGNHADRL